MLYLFLKILNVCLLIMDEFKKFFSSFLLMFKSFKKKKFICPRNTERNKTEGKSFTRWWQYRSCINIYWCMLYNYFKWVCKVLYKGTVWHIILTTTKWTVKDLSESEVSNFWKQSFKGASNDSENVFTTGM